MIYTLTLNPALDYVVNVPDFQLGQVNRTKAEQIVVGGKGINVSLMLQHLGIQNVALGFVAGFTGEEICRLLKEEGCASDFVRVLQGMSRINVKLKSGEESEINGQGPKIGEEELTQLFWRLDGLKEGDTLVLAGSVPGCLPALIYKDICRRLETKKIRFVIDAEGELLRSALSFRPFLIKPNQAELAALSGKKLNSRKEIREAAWELQRQGARNVLVSMAGEGALLLTEEGRLYEREAPKGIVKNSVGAGDSMVAGFLAGYEETQDYETAFLTGIAAGSASAFSVELAKKEEVERLLALMGRKDS